MGMSFSSCARETMRFLSCQRQSVQSASGTFVQKPRPGEWNCLREFKYAGEGGSSPLEPAEESFNKTPELYFEPGGCKESRAAKTLCNCALAGYRGIPGEHALGPELFPPFIQQLQVFDCVLGDQAGVEGCLHAR